MSEPRPRPLLRTTLGDVLRRTRQDQGRTLADVAEQARVSMPYLSEVERGRKEASSEVLAAICDSLRIGLPDLLTEASRELAGASGQLAAGNRDAESSGLAAGGARQASVVELDSIRRRRAASARRGSGDVVLLAA